MLSTIAVVTAALGADAQEDIGALHRLGERPQIRRSGVGRFPLVHALCPALVDDTLCVAGDTVVVACAHRLEQLQTGDPGGAGTVQHDADVLDLLVGQVQRVDQSRGADHRSPMLIIVEHGDVHDLLQPVLNDEAVGRLDVLEVDAAKGRTHQPHGRDELVGVRGVELDVDGIHIGEALEEHSLALHHRLRRQRAEVAEAQDRRAVGDHGDEVALVGVVVGRLRRPRDLLARNSDPGAVGETQVVLRRHRDARPDVELARPRLHVELKRVLPRDLSCH